MARPALTNEEHSIRGTKPQSKPATESHVRAGRPKMPKDIKGSPELRKIFKSLVNLLAERRALSKGDAELISLYCYAKDRHLRNAQLLREEGDLVEYYRLDSNGQSVPQVKENLRLKICVTAEKEMTSILSQLGLSPTAKDKARPTKRSDLTDGPKDAMEEFMTRQPQPGKPLLVPEAPPKLP